jgi:hypothetical protein
MPHDDHARKGQGDSSSFAGSFHKLSPPKVAHQYRKRKERDTPGSNSAEVHSVSPMERVGSGGGVRGWKRLARGMEEPYSKRPSVRRAEDLEALDPAVEGPLNSSSGLLTSQGEQPEVLSLPLKKVSTGHKTTKVIQLVAPVQGHELNSPNGVDVLTMAARQPRRSL